MIENIYGPTEATVACLRVDSLPPRTPAELLFLAPPLFARLFQ